MDDCCKDEVGGLKTALQLEITGCWGTRLGVAPAAPEGSLLTGHSEGEPDPFQQLASERRTQST